MSGYGTYVARRLLLLVPTLALLSAGAFFMEFLVPVDPARNWCNIKCPQREYLKIRHQLGLDQPPWVQYVRYMQHLLHGDLGFSSSARAPVAQVLAAAMPATLELTVTAVVLAVVLGILGGVVSAAYRNRLADHVTRFVAVVGVSLPIFFVAFLLKWTFAYNLELFPVGGAYDHYVFPVPPRVTGVVIIDALLGGEPGLALNGLWHLALPAVALTLAPLGAMVRLTRSGVLDTLGEDYLRTARAKGVSEGGVLLRHALPNSLIPTVTVLGAQLANILGGSVIVETVFDWPGMGGFAAQAALFGDTTGLVDLVLIFAIVLILANLTVDLLYGILDPRIRLS